VCEERIKLTFVKSVLALQGLQWGQERLELLTLRFVVYCLVWQSEQIVKPRRNPSQWGNLTDPSGGDGGGGHAGDGAT